MGILNQIEHLEHEEQLYIIYPL